MADIATLTAAELEARIAELERRLGVVDPAALVPPITIGELTDVPAPGSQLAAAWAQEVSSRVVQRFPNVATLQAWAAPPGAFAVDLATGVVWRRGVGTWNQFSPWHGTGVGIAAGSPTGVVVVASLTIPADPGARTAAVSSYVVIDVFNANQVSVELLVDNQQVAIATIPVTQALATPGVNMKWNLSLSGLYNLPADRPIGVQTRITPDTTGAGVWSVAAGPQRNRVDATVSPRGF